MNYRPIQALAVLALACAVFACSCDSTKPTRAEVSPEVRAEWESVKKRIDSGKYFRRVEALDQFIALEPPPMMLLEAKALRKKYQAMAETQVGFDEALARVSVAKREAGMAEEKAMWESSDLEQYRTLLVRHLASDYEIHGWGDRLESSVELPGRGGDIVTYPTPARLDPIRLRESIHRMFGQFGVELEDDCKAECLNSALDRKLFKVISGELFLGLGKLDGQRLDTIAEAFWIEPDEKLMGVDGKDYYAVFSRVPRDLYLSRRALAEYGDDRALEAYREVRKNSNGPFDRAIVRYYRLWTRETGLNEDLEGKVEYRLIDTYIGFWLRRMFDGTEPVVSKWMLKTLETYDPEFLASIAESDGAAGPPTGESPASP